ncbi:metalloendopeptidase [Coemansia erecta]|uniref:Metalloendopeptidase n=1 Tax=Coemansia erecta TaxID=147472 RepID=A0A9W7XZ24_9FUNG|nr:metalloendopeptidase [Coemansia erecta]
MRYAKDESVRREMYSAFSKQCPDNTELLQKAIGLRAKAAQLLGYKSHAEYVISDKMAKTSDNVTEFISSLRDKLCPLAKHEIAEREELKKADKETSGEEYRGLFKWDTGYYTTIIKERKHDINMEEVKKYFSSKSVVSGILDIYQNMLSLRFAKVENPPVWHPDVEMYEVREAASDDFLGHFYLDLFPRENKYNHAAMWPIRTAHTNLDGSLEYPVAAMVANFPKATSSTPALMQHGDVVTFMHEMGHVFHSLCSRTKWSRFHGPSVEGDFVEAPSQMLENWAWEPSVLQKFAVHYKTGEAIPEDLIKRLVASKNEGSGIFYLRQLLYGSYDMELHNTSTGDVDVKKIFSDLSENITMLTEDDENTWDYTTFGHVMSEYSAGYYGYLWSQVFSADMYNTRFLRDGVDNPQTGLDYRREILLPGSSRDGSISLRAFLGREPQNDAFLKSIGLSE